MGLSKNGLDLQALVTAAITMIWAVQIWGSRDFHNGNISDASTPQVLPQPQPLPQPPAFPQPKP